MEVEFADKQLEVLASSLAAQKTQYSIALIRAFQNKLLLLKNAPDERTLRNWKSLHYEKLKGKKKNERSTRLNDQWRLIFELDNKTSPKTIRITRIEDYH